jgi:hypothetical protein
LEARARERESVLVVAEARGAVWPGGAAYALHAAGSEWDGLERDGLECDGLECGAGLLAGRRLQVQVEGRGAAARPRVGELARAG